MAEQSRNGSPPAQTTTCSHDQVPSRGTITTKPFKNVVQKCCWANQLTIGGKTPLELALGSPPKPIHDLQHEDPAQLSEDPPKEDNALTLQRLALRAHQEARQLQDLRKDIARNLR